jgi:hypothetical protein
MKSSARTAILVLVVVILLVSLFAVIYFVLLKERHNHALVAIYPTAVPGHDPVNNAEMFLSDLDLVKSLGFEGVRLHPADYEEYGYGKVANDLDNRSLKFVMVLQGWDDAQFPQNNTYVNEVIAYFQNIAAQLKNKTNLLWYAMNYPYDWNRTSDQLNDTIYHIQLQRIIDYVKAADPDHRIFLVSGVIDTVAVPPMDFNRVDGFGIMPYSADNQTDSINATRIHWLDKYRDTGKEVYIAEWGVQTIENSPNRTYFYGQATNETMKVKIIQEFLSYIHGWGIYWDYFGLHDFPPEHSDWGIAYDNNTLKPSGENLKSAITG